MKIELFTPLRRADSPLNQMCIDFFDVGFDLAADRFVGRFKVGAVLSDFAGLIGQFSANLAQPVGIGFDFSLHLGQLTRQSLCVGVEPGLFGLQGTGSFAEGSIGGFHKRVPILPNNGQVLGSRIAKYARIGQARQGFETGPGGLHLFVFGQTQTSETSQCFAKLEIIGAWQVCLGQYIGKMVDEFRIDRAGYRRGTTGRAACRRSGRCGNRWVGWGRLIGGLIGDEKTEQSAAERGWGLCHTEALQLVCENNVTKPAADPVTIPSNGFFTCLTGQKPGRTYSHAASDAVGIRWLTRWTEDGLIYN